MRRISLTQGLFAIVDDEDFEYLNQWKWFATRQCRSIYAVRNRRISDGPGPGRIYMHRVILNPPNGLETDHINGNGLDDRRVNLRAVTSDLNKANQVHVRRNRAHSLPIGVTAHRQKFQARIQIGGLLRHLGTHDTPDEAHAVYMQTRDKRLSVGG